ncbi:hypothetical protein ES705_31240 [subsurface metagenome]
MPCFGCGKNVPDKKLIGTLVCGDVLVHPNGADVIQEPGVYGFCSNSCAWRYLMRKHRALGMEYHQIVKHLEEDHGLKPPGQEGDYNYG